MQNYKMFAACKAFIVHEGKILLVREAQAYEDGTNIGKFDVVGGRVTPGEHFLDGLKREITEETGLDVAIGRPFFVNEWRPQPRGEQWHIVATFFECSVSSPDVQLSTDHNEYLWVHPEDYEELPIIENLKNAFEAYLSYRNDVCK